LIFQVAGKKNKKGSLSIKWWRSKYAP